MANTNASEEEQRALMACLYDEMFKCRCGIVVSSRPVRGGSDTEGCQYCLTRFFGSQGWVYVRQPWPDFDAHIRTYNGLSRLVDRIYQGRDLLFEVAKVREGVPAAEIKRLAAARTAFIKPSKQAEAYLMIEFEEAADRPLLDEIAREVEEVARRMFARHGHSMERRSRNVAPIGRA